jgi:IS5 family transposase
MNGFDSTQKRHDERCFWKRWSRLSRGAELCALIEPHYRKPGNGRPPVGVKRMLRMYFLQQWFNLSDPTVEEACMTRR